MLYDVVLVSAVQQLEAAIIICISFPSWASFPYSIPRHRPSQSTRSSSLCCIATSLLTSCLTYDSIYMSMLLSPFVPLCPFPTEWSMSERQKQISYMNAYIWNLEKWYWQTCLQGWNRDADVENGLVNVIFFFKDLLYLCWFS